MPGTKAETPFDRFRELARKLAAVPKREADEEKAKKAAERGPKPAHG